MQISNNYTSQQNIYSQKNSNLRSQKSVSFGIPRLPKDLDIDSFNKSYESIRLLQQDSDISSLKSKQRSKSKDSKDIYSQKSLDLKSNSKDSDDFKPNLENIPEYHIQDRTLQRLDLPEAQTKNSDISDSDDDGQGVPVNNSAADWMTTTIRPWQQKK